MTFSKTSAVQVGYSENYWIMHRYLIEAKKVCSPFKLKICLFFCLFGASFMLIACSEVKGKKGCYLRGYGAMI